MEKMNKQVPEMTEEEKRQMSEDFKEAKDMMQEGEEFLMDEEEFDQGEGSQFVYQGGPTFDQVANWKSAFDGEIYASNFGDDTFIWRPIKRKEFRDIQNIEGTVDEYYKEEQICQRCILWPENWNAQKQRLGKAGLPTILSQLIMEKSGFIRPVTYRI